jgi:hypothetical protein
MDKLADIMVKYYRQIKGELIPPRKECTKECPKESLWWNYVRGELEEKEREQVEGHLLACPACLESLKVIRMIQQVQASPQQVPAQLHQKAREILQNELSQAGLGPKGKPVILKIALFWDRLLERITQLTPQLTEGNMGMAMSPQFQPVRKIRQDAQEDFGTFPIARTIDLPEGTIALEIDRSDIDRSDKDPHLILKTSFQLKPHEVAGRQGRRGKQGSLRLLLYKSDRLCSSTCLDPGGEAVVNRIKEGEYYVELLAGEESLGVIWLSIGKE